MHAKFWASKTPILAAPAAVSALAAMEIAAARVDSYFPLKADVAIAI
jgi:hypothetical protein